MSDDDQPQDDTVVNDYTAEEDNLIANGEEEEATADEDDLLATNNERAGTTASARFNILSTMVGGGSLSLPLAFQKSGNALVGPLLLLVTALITEFCFRIHVGSSRIISPVSSQDTHRGKDTFESVARAAFGPSANVFSMTLVVFMCFFGACAYAVLLRDMLQPVTEAIWHTSESGPTFQNNLTMLAVVLLVTPLCTLKTLTSLEKFGAASMFSVLILGSCIVYRSAQCNIYDNTTTHRAFKFLPDTWKDLLDVFPLFVSCYVCHYNLVPVHNELRRPSPERTSWWLRSTVWSSTAFYMTIGIAGSAYGHCTESGNVQGNILLDFPEDDVLLLIGRSCLALTLTMAFPMLTIPARDILIRCLPASFFKPTSSQVDNSAEEQEQALQEPLLEREEDVEEGRPAVEDGEVEASLGLRLGAAIVVFWSSALVASCVASIDIVWDLLGSSLSILLSYLIPCGSYLVIVKKFDSDTGGDLSPVKVSKYIAWALIIFYVPMMFVSTANAVVDTFFHKK